MPVAAGSPTLRVGPGARPTTRLAVTPALRQAIRLLELPALELGQVLRAALEANPWLDLADEAEPLADVAAGHEVAAGLGPDDGPDGDSDAWPGEPRGEPDVPAPGPDLRDHVRQQLRLQAPGAARNGALSLVEWLDDDGYLRHHDLARVQCGLDERTFAAALGRLQACDPAGVGARDLAECITLQLRVVAPGDRLAAAIARDHLDLAARGGVRRLARLLGAPPAAVERALEAIRRCDPKPGRLFSGGGAAGVVPDVVVERDGDGYAVLVNDGLLPRLRLSPTYRRLMRDREHCPSEARVFLEGRLAEAMRLLRAVEVRRQTLFRVTEAILVLQRGYFEHGAAHLRPLTLVDVARVAGVHPSTVSRATMGKYLQTPRGTVAFRFFFSAAAGSGHPVGTAGADPGGRRRAPRPAPPGVPTRAVPASAAAVQARLRALIAAEDPGAPLSDAALARRLAAEGLAAARRTVAKYRDALRIPPAAARRRRPS